MLKLLFALSLSIVCSAAAMAQAKKIDFYSASDLAAREQAMKAKVDPTTGLVGVTLEKYPNHLTMFILREKDGQSELHDKVADVFMAVDGKAELWTGGTMVDAKTTDKGESRGSGLNGGSKILLQKGDIVHIPAGIPHQVRIAKGGHFAYFVVKSEEGK